MLIIGSRAFDFGRAPRDHDYIATPAELAVYKESVGDKLVLAKKSKFGETLFVSGSQPIEIDCSETGQELLDIVGHGTANADVLLTIKMSHRFLKNSVHFLKTMRDIQTLRAHGAVVPEGLTEWLKKRSKFTYDYAHPKLNQNSKDFFNNDGVPYVFSHDSIHEAVALYGRPAFEQIRVDGEEVFTSKEKFFAMPEHLQLATVYEESAVLALERALIPNDFNFDPYKAFTIALQKCASSISSGYWRLYCWENYDKVLAMYNENYVTRFKKALSENKVLPYEG